MKFGHAHGLPLSASKPELLELIIKEAPTKGHEEVLLLEKELRSPPNKHNQSKYYLYHHDHGHDTEECIQLQDKIEELIKRVWLGQFLRLRSKAREDQLRPLSQPEPPRREEQQEDRSFLNIINTISEGLSTSISCHLSILELEEAFPSSEAGRWWLAIALSPLEIVLMMPRGSRSPHYSFLIGGSGCSSALS